MTTSLTKALKGNVRHLLSVRDRPTQKAGPKWTHTVYYAVTTELRRSGVSESMARRTDSACMLVKVCDKSGREVDRLPEALVTPLRSARGATAEKKAQAFFRALAALAWGGGARGASPWSRSTKVPVALA